MAIPSAAPARCRLTSVLFLCVAYFAASVAVASDTTAPLVRIGVMTKGNEQLTMQRWPPMAAYLEQHIPTHRFRIVPLGFDQVNQVVASKKIDFLLANPAVFVEMEGKYHVAAMLTLKRRVAGDIALAKFAGAVIVRAERKDIRDYPDLKGKRFAAVNENAFGGWAMAWRQMKLNGIDPFTDLAAVEFLGSHEAVVQEVLSGKVDAGTVRTGVLEHMADNGQLDLQQLYVLPEEGNLGHPPIEFSVLHSTAYYPEWPIASLQHVDPGLVKQVTRALLGMTPADAAASIEHIVGWEPPSNYLSVHALMQDLKLAQYKHYGEVSLLEAARQHWRWVLAVAVLLTLLLLVVIYTSYLNRLNRETTRSLQDEIKQKAIAEQELKAKNQRIQESEQRLAAILENILEAVVTIDQRGCIQTFNHAAETMFGFRQDEVLGASVSMLMPPSDAEYHQSYVKDYLQNGDAKVIGIGRETEGLRNNGDVFPLELAVSELAVQGRRMFVGIMRDLTEKKAHETRQRQVEKLEAVSQMAGGFAHEFNNHLSSIVGYTDMLLLDVGDNKELASDLGRVMDAAVRAKILVKQLLDISRSDYEDALVLVPQKIIEDVVVLLRGLLPEGADLHYEPLRDECQIRLSPFQFQQIVLNLGMNAIEALKEGGRIDISLKCIELSEAAAGQEGLGAGDYTLLTVCDDGAGMTPEQMQHIFEASAHAHDQVKEQVVGLAAIKEVVTRNGGVIEVESEPGQGACFKVYLPCSIT